MSCDRRAADRGGLASSDDGRLLSARCIKYSRFTREERSQVHSEDRKTTAQTRKSSIIAYAGV